MSDPLLDALDELKNLDDAAWKAYKTERKGPYYEGQADAFGQARTIIENATESAEYLAMKQAAIDESRAKEKDRATGWVKRWAEGWNAP